MPNSLQSSAIASPASHKLQSFIHYRTLLPRHHSLPFYGEKVLPTCPVQCVTYVSGRSVARISGKSSQGAESESAVTPVRRVLFILGSHRVEDSCLSARAGLFSA